MNSYYFFRQQPNMATHTNIQFEQWQQQNLGTTAEQTINDAKDYARAALGAAG